MSIIAAKTRLASAPLAASASINTRGEICQEIPQRSLHQPHALSSPPLLLMICADTAHKRDSIFTKGPADVLDHATSEIAMGTKLGIDATRKLAGEGFKRPWPPLIRMDEAVQRQIDVRLKAFE